ncbi:hypothetical protein COCOBI_11-0120 [Coccomyxa sp. Obi]|nr:hypothetical protein COCOBI_11-0120 [Coccomyxa sp. Obi]
MAGVIDGGSGAIQLYFELGDQLCQAPLVIFCLRYILLELLQTRYLQTGSNQNSTLHRIKGVAEPRSRGGARGQAHLEFNSSTEREAQEVSKAAEVLLLLGDKGLCDPGTLKMLRALTEARGGVPSAGA